MKNLLLLFFIFAAFGGSAQFEFTGGPLNITGSCKALWASGDTAFMGYNEGLYRTFNGGDSWDYLTTNIAYDVDPRTIEYTDGLLVVGTNDDARVYRSTDWGESFQGGGNGMALLIPTASAAGPGVHMIGGTLVQPSIYDFGLEDWQATDAGGSLTHGIAYTGLDTLWQCAGGVTSGVTKYSTDAGTTWTAVANEPQTDIGGGIIMASIAQDFVMAGSRIIVGTNLVNFPVLYSDDMGTTWEAADLPSTTWSDYGKRFLKVNDNHLLTVNLSGVWKSTDQGESWTMIQEVSQINTMRLWKNDHLLVGTENGVCEFANYGEGDLVQKLGTPSDATGLISLNGMLLSMANNSLQGFDPMIQEWTIINDQSEDGTPLGNHHFTLIQDSLFVCGSTLQSSGDGGLTFQNRSNESFNWASPTAIAELNGTKFVGAGTGIYFSVDNGSTYSASTFTNTISYGFGALDQNFIEGFHATSNLIVADMNAGYAISNDNGMTWTFYGDVWMNTFFATEGETIFNYTVTGIWQDERSFETSTDGENWTAISTAGLSNDGYGGVWNIDGTIYTYQAFSEPHALFQFDAVASSWTEVEGTVGPAFTPTLVEEFQGNFYANWQLNGTWASNANPDFVEGNELLSTAVFPNPASNQITIENKTSSLSILEIYSISGALIESHSLSGFRATINVSHLSKGSYIFHILGMNSIENHIVLLD